MWVDVVWSVTVFVFVSPVGTLFIFSVVSSINGHCLPALSHCLGDRMRKQADFCTEPFFPTNWHNSC